MIHNENGTQPADKTESPTKSRKRNTFAKKLQSATRKRKTKSGKQTNRTADSAKKKIAWAELSEAELC